RRRALAVERGGRGRHGEARESSAEEGGQGLAGLVGGGIGRAQQRDPVPAGEGLSDFDADRAEPDESDARVLAAHRAAILLEERRAGRPGRTGRPGGRKGVLGPRRRSVATKRNAPGARARWG